MIKGAIAFLKKRDKNSISKKKSLKKLLKNMKKLPEVNLKITHPTEILEVLEQ